MKNKSTKYNSKTTKISCVSCNHDREVSKSNAKYCSTLCRVNERNYRIEKGFTYFVFKGSEKELKEFYNKYNIFLLSFPFKNDLHEFETIIKTNNLTKSLKHEYGNYILYYFDNLKVDKYELFYNKSKYDALKVIEAKFNA